MAWKSSMIQNVDNWLYVVRASYNIVGVITCRMYYIRSCTIGLIQRTHFCDDSKWMIEFN